MVQAKPNDTVKVHYTGRLEDGTIFGSSANRDPIEFTIGAEGVVPGFSKAVIGMTPGEHKTETLPPSLGYGHFRNELVQEIARDLFPADIQLAVGQRFNASGPGRNNMIVTIVHLSEGTVTVDANHPLAGRNLVFDIELVEIV